MFFFAQRSACRRSPITGRVRRDVEPLGCGPLPVAREVRILSDWRGALLDRFLSALSVARPCDRVHRARFFCLGGDRRPASRQSRQDCFCNGSRGSTPMPPSRGNAVWFLMIFPTSYFLHINYTESFFLALVLGCLLAARLDCWAIAGMLGAVRLQSRGSTGLLLVPTLAVEVWQRCRLTRRIDWRWLWIGAVGVRLPRLSRAELSRHGRSVRLLEDDGGCAGTRNSRRRGSVSAMSGNAYREAN